MNRIDFTTYSKNALALAPYLLGKLLCVNINDEVIKARITETEAYFGEEDTACHAHKGKTKRTQTLYMQGGTAYVYLCYGIHALLNVVSGNEGHPEAVLIRGVEGFNGPGKLTKAMGITCALNGTDLCNSDVIWIENDGFEVKRIETSPRIGIDYADEKDRNSLWRFYYK
ncbi:MAG: DNA-3-methyladenine glycosylase [Ruminococcus sp.]